MKQHNLLRRITLLIIGQIIMAFGINLILYVNIGVDPLGVFHTGVANLLNTSFAVALFVENLIALIIVYIFDKRYINIGTIITLFLVSFVSGPITQVYYMIIPTGLNLFISLLLLLGACILMGVGLNLYVLSDIGVGAMDAIIEIIVDKSKYEIGIVKITVDILYLIIGIFLGGSIGIGTLFCALMLGTCIQITRKLLEKPILMFTEAETVN